MNKRRQREQKKQRQDKPLIKPSRASEEQRQHMQEMLDQEDYAGVLRGLADLVQKGCYDTDMMYLGASSYFMQGDYTRAASMVDSVLTLAPAHIAARILLARICILENRANDGLAIFDFLAEHEADQLTQEQREDIEDIVDYYVQTEKEHIQQDFPNLAVFLGLVEEAQIEPAASAAANDKEVLLSSERAEEKEDKSREGKQTEKAADGDASEEIASVMGQYITLQDKVRLLNAFAAAHFAAGEYAMARSELEQALRIDQGADVTIRNMAVLLKRQGHCDQAVAAAAKLSQPDFLLLDYLLNK